MTEADEKRLAEIEARAEAATPGPWSYECLASRNYRRRVRADHCSIATIHALVHQHANGDFISSARSDIPWLVAQLRAAWAQLDAVRAEERERCAKAICQRCYNGEPHGLSMCEARRIRQEDQP